MSAKELLKRPSPPKWASFFDNVEFLVLKHQNRSCVTDILQIISIVGPLVFAYQPLQVTLRLQCQIEDDFLVKIFLTVMYG
jgi:hypothetical protein